MPCSYCHPDPGTVFHEGDLVRGLWGGSPGHALLVTRRHVADWFTASQAEQRELSETIALVRDRILDTHAPDGFNVGINIGEAAGQSVPHLHVHVIPRYRSDADGAPHSGHLVTGESDPLAAHLKAHLERAHNVDLAIAFVQASGLRVLWPDLVRMLQRDGSRLRLVTGDYLGVTDPVALVDLLNLQERYPTQLHLRVFETRGHVFHPKAYLIADGQGRAVSFVGSSNLSQSALTTGVQPIGRVGELVLRPHAAHLLRRKRPSGAHLQSANSAPQGACSLHLGHLRTQSFAPQRVRWVHGATATAPA